LERGPGLAARARAARYDALETACGDAGIVHLLLGHHAADQAETVTMRLLGRSGPDGLAGMARVVETTALRRLRPLLATSPASLRATLRAERLEWVEDPSNADPAALRARLRRLRHDAGGDGPVTRAAVKAAAIRAKRRAAAEEARAATLAQRAEMHPEAYALLSPGPIEAEALARLFALLAGASYLPSLERIAAIAAAPRPTTLGGVRVLPAGRLAPGHWLLVREAAAMGPPIPARRGSIWDGRFRLRIDVPGASIGALGADAARVRQLSRLPAAVLATLPAFRRKGRLIGVPHLNYQGELPQGPDSVVFHPPFPAAGAPFGPGSPAQVGS
ncbi:MAG: tRNA lysidine(34) synthetase TilS, partial [Rhodospirillales bacterium]|nr:tRNA lysidine(34) synthetase TilS [Rhodospirillales bacterium]